MQNVTAYQDGKGQGFDKTRDAASYDAHAASYDTYITRLSDPLAVRICELARVTSGDRVLDVGTGAGIAARRAALAVGAAGEVLGIDLSAGMIDTARQSVAEWESKPPTFRLMDAERLDLPDAAFDAVVSLCAVRHMPNIERALGEMYRVLKPAGAVVVSCGHVRPISVLPLGRHIAKRVIGELLLPVRPRLIGPSFLTRLAFQLLPEPSQVVETEWGGRDPHAALKKFVHDAGFEQVEPSWWGHEVVFDSAEEFWEAQTSIVTVVRKRILEAPADAVTRLKQAFLSKADDVLRRGGTLIYPYGAYYVRARRPG